MAAESSGLRFIDNQPVVFNLDQDPCLGFLDPGYRGKWQTTDDVHIQIERFPCGTNAACTNASPSYDANIVLNPTFDTDIANWIASSGDWSWDGVGAAQKTASIIPQTISQSMATPVGMYRLRIAFTRSAGIFSLFVNSDLITQVTSNTTIDVEVFNSVDPMVITVSGDEASAGTIDNVIIERIYYCYDGPGWIYDTADNSYTHLITYTNELAAVTDIFEVGRVYKIAIRIENATGGTAQIVVGSGASEALSGNGSFSRYINSDVATGFYILPSADFDGTVYIDEIYVLTDLSDLMLVDADGNDIASLMGFYTTADNKINVKFKLSELTLEGGDADEEVPVGCYRVRASGLCNPILVNLVQDGEFDLGDFTKWAPGSHPHQYDMSGGTLTFIYEPLEGANLVTDGNPIAAPGWTPGANWAFIGTGWQHTPGSTATLSQSITIGTPAVFPARLDTYYQVKITNRTAGGVTVTISDSTSSLLLGNLAFMAQALPRPTIGGVVTFAITPTSNFDGTIEIVKVHQTNKLWQTPSVANPANANIIAGDYRITYDIISITGELGNEIGAFCMIQYPSATTYGTGVGTHTHNQLGYVPGSTLIELGGDFIGQTTYPGRVEVDNVIVERLVPAEGVVYSNLLHFAASWPCTKWIEGYGDCFAHGFDFRGGFKIAMRVPFLKFGPGYPIKESSYVHSDGENERTSSERDKVYQAKVDKVDEIVHDALSVALLCPTFTIDGEEYFFKGKEYRPQWDKSGRFSTARASFELSPKTSATFHSNCGDCGGVNETVECLELCQTAVTLKSLFAGAAGWYMVDGENTLEFHNGTTWTGTQEGCEGLIDCFPGAYGTYDYSGPYQWNNTSGEWQSIISVGSIAKPGTVVSLEALIKPNSSGRIQTSIDGGTNWVNATTWYSASQLFAGISFNEPAAVPFRFRLIIKHFTCTYYGAPITDFE